LRVQIPAKAKFAPTCVRNSLLSELSWECITYLLICWFVYIGKNRRFTAFLDSKIYTRLTIVTANELGLAFPPMNLPKKFRPDPSTFYLVIVVTDKQTNVRRWFHNPSRQDTHNITNAEICNLLTLRQLTLTWTLKMFVFSQARSWNMSLRLKHT